jgi:hypothetical protein
MGWEVGCGVRVYWWGESVLEEFGGVMLWLEAILRDLFPSRLISISINFHPDKCQSRLQTRSPSPSPLSHLLVWVDDDSPRSLANVLPLPPDPFPARCPNAVPVVEYRGFLRAAPNNKWAGGRPYRVSAGSCYELEGADGGGTGGEGGGRTEG